MRKQHAVSSAVCIATLLFTFNLATPLTAGTVPELTGTFNGYPWATITPCNFITHDPGGFTPFAVDVDFGSYHFEVWNVGSSTTTSVTGQFGPGYSCSFRFVGTVDGPITGAYDALTFTGVVTNGSFTFNYNFNQGFVGWFGGFSAAFRGFWSNGYYSTAVIGGSFFYDAGYQQNGGVLEITTVTTPEPSALLMLGAGLLPVFRVVRRTLHR